MGGQDHQVKRHKREASCERSPRGGKATWSGVGGEDRVKVVPPDTSMLLVVHGKNFTASAVWERRKGVWRCVRAGPMIEWMTRVKHPDCVLGWIKAIGATFEWKR